MNEPADVQTLLTQLPALQVVVPLVGAVLVALFRNGTVGYLMTLAVGWTMPVISLLLMHQVLATGPISYALGGWAPPIGIEYRVDVLSAFVLTIVSIMAALVVTYAPRSIAAEIPRPLRGWYYAMFLVCLSGLQGMAISGDAFNIFVFMEISSLSMYALIAMGRDRRALVAAFQYLILGTLGATFYVIGVGIAFTLTGTLNLVDLAAKLPSLANTPSGQVSLAFVAVGLGLKIAMFPLHLWLPNAYAFAPTVATAFIGSTATKVAVYVFLRFQFSVFGGEMLNGGNGGGAIILMVIAVAGMIGPSLVAVFEINIKRVLAYSSIAQIGYILLGIALANQSGLTGSISHMFNHALIKGCLFLAAGAVLFSTGATKVEHMAGVGRTMPLTMAAFVIAGLGLIGVPGTAGFVSKWYLIQGAAQAELWWLVGAIVFSSLIAVFYVGRIVQVAWFRPPNAATATPRAVPTEMSVAIWLLAIAVIYFGLQTQISAGFPADAATMLLERTGYGQ